MSESKHMGRCRSEMTAAYRAKSFKPNDSDEVMADAIDRLAADVAEIKAKVEQIAPDDVRQFVESEKAWVALVAAIRERDEARAEVEKLKAIVHSDAGHMARILNEVERLRAELAARPADGNSPKTSESSPAAPQPAAPQAGWLTERERHVLSSMLSERPCDWSLHWTDDVQPVFRSILARAGSPPVVEVPAMSPATYGFDSPFFSGEYRAGRRQACLTHRAALDKAGVQWKEKEVGRE